MDQDTLQRHHRSYIHETCDPKMAVQEKHSPVHIRRKAFDNAWHEATNDDEIADSDSKAFDCNRGVEYDRSVWVRDLR